MKIDKAIGGNRRRMERLRIQIRRDGAVHGLRRDLLGVRAARDRISEVVRRASLGEQIVIARRGVPTAMVVQYTPVRGGRPYEPNLALLRSMPMTSDSRPGIRAERDSGP
jgi:prevent-host-death family protein